jgi:hypothetical protein
MSYRDLASYNEPLRTEVLTLVTEYYKENNYPKYLHTHWIADIVFNSNGKYPIMKKMRKQAVNHFITQGIKYLFDTEVVRRSDSGYGAVFMVVPKEQS